MDGRGRVEADRGWWDGYGERQDPAPAHRHRDRDPMARGDVPRLPAVGSDHHVQPASDRPVHDAAGSGLARRRDVTDDGEGGLRKRLPDLLGRDAGPRPLSGLRGGSDRPLAGLPTFAYRWVVLVAMTPSFGLSGSVARASPARDLHTLAREDRDKGRRHTPCRDPWTNGNGAAGCDRTPRFGSTSGRNRTYVRPYVVGTFDDPACRRGGVCGGRGRLVA